MARFQPTRDEIVLGDNLEILPRFADGSFQLIYVDPPFNTGGEQRRLMLATVPDEDGDRVGFKGERYRTRLLNESSYRDEFDDYLGFLEPRLREARRLLTASGTFYRTTISTTVCHRCTTWMPFGRLS